MNWFSIRAHSSIEDESIRHEMAKKYSEHLQRIERDVESPKNLLQFFGTDFFHDGAIEAIHHIPCRNEVAMTIWGPNIKFRKDEQNHEYLCCKFHVRFIDVVLFDMKLEKADRYNDPLHNGSDDVQYVYGEIDGLTEEINHYNVMYKADGLFFHSLVFETLPCWQWYKLVFSDVRIRAEENLAFEMMKRDLRYEVPVYNSGKD